MGIKQHRAPHTMGIKTHMVLKNNSNPSAYTSDSVVIDNKNLSEYEPLGVKNSKNSKSKSKLER